MAKDYSRKNSVRRHGSVSKQLLLVLVCFLLGYLSASIFDFTSLSSWVNTQVLAQHTIPIAIKTPPEAQLPKPKLEFYTLLSSEHINTNAPGVDQIVTVTPSRQTTPANPSVEKNKIVPSVAINENPIKTASTAANLANKGSYLVQIASFKSRQEADRMKATLAIKGFNVNVAVVTQQQMLWYRVVLGPFPSRTEAEQARVSISQHEHITGMIRRMDA